MSYSAWSKRLENQLYSFFFPGFITALISRTGETNIKVIGVRNFPYGGHQWCWDSHDGICSFGQRSWTFVVQNESNVCLNDFHCSTRQLPAFRWLVFHTQIVEYVEKCCFHVELTVMESFEISSIVDTAPQEIRCSHNTQTKETLSISLFYCVIQLLFHASGVHQLHRTKLVGSQLAA